MKEEAGKKQNSQGTGKKEKSKVNGKGTREERGSETKKQRSKGRTRQTEKQRNRETKKQRTIWYDSYHMNVSEAIPRILPKLADKISSHKHSWTHEGPWGPMVTHGPHGMGQGWLRAGGRRQRRTADGRRATGVRRRRRSSGGVGQGQVAAGRLCNGIWWPT